MQHKICQRLVVIVSCICVPHDVPATVSLRDRMMSSPTDRPMLAARRRFDRETATKRAKLCNQLFAETPIQFGLSTTKPNKSTNAILSKFALIE
jgi:hypothetical protein